MTDLTKTRTETDPSTLHQWKGRPVPWVARWTREASSHELSVGTREDGTLVCFYKDGQEDRDPNGVLWMREGLTRGGEPEFAQLSAMRQRASMRRRLCQVCGKKIEEPVIRWLVDPRQVSQVAGETITSSPPTCEACVPLALSLCPAMKNSHKIARVLEYEPWGAVGTVVRKGERGQLQSVQHALVDYSRKDYPFPFTAVVARQRAVRWVKYTMEED